jgi:hypothetical protein
VPDARAAQDLSIKTMGSLTNTNKINLPLPEEAGENNFLQLEIASEQRPATVSRIAVVCIGLFDVALIFEDVEQGDNGA